jgi:hypothetical protein
MRSSPVPASPRRRSDMEQRPVLLNSCKFAATAAEARFRIDAPIAPSRATVVIGADLAGADVVREVAGLDWHTARFYSCAPSANGGDPDGLILTSIDRTTTPLAAELDGVDAVVVVAATAEAASAAATIGAACTVRGIMTVGVVLPSDATTGAMSALRPHARVLMVPGDSEDLAELLRAIRA